MAAQAPCRCRQLGGRPGGSRRPTLHLHAPAAQLVTHAATKPIEQKLYWHRSTGSSKRRHAFSSCGTKWVKVIWHCRGLFLARARLHELRCLVVHMHRSEGRVPRWHRCSGAHELLPMAPHQRSIDSAVIIGLRLRDKAPAALTGGRGLVGPSKSGTFDDRGG
jgi:hypothetical protein